MLVNSILKVKAFDVSFEGLGVCRFNNQIIFVENLLKNESAHIKITQVKKKFCFAVVIEHIDCSIDRVEPQCEFYFECGGCHISHMSNDIKRDLKRKQLTNLSNDLDVEVVDCLSDLDRLKYRNKISMHVMKFGTKIMCGMYSKKTNRVVGNSCLLMTDKCQKVHKKIVELLNFYDVCVYNAKTKRGLREVVYRTNENNDIMLVFVATHKTKKMLMVSHEISKVVQGIYFSVADEIIPYKDCDMINTVGNFLYRVSPKSFFQVNNHTCKVMFDAILEECKFNGDEVLLDAYCGTGAIGIYLAKYVSKVIGIDISKSSIKDANFNVNLNDVLNATYLHGDIFTVIQNSNVSFDVVVVDPPRSGCSKKFISHLLDNCYSKVVYMSCNPATLTRDLKLLSSKYNIDTIKIFDMFPNTYHIESLCILTSKQIK